MALSEPPSVLLAGVAEGARGLFVVDQLAEEVARLMAFV
jgi:hypothetical protein